MFTSNTTYPFPITTNIVEVSIVDSDKKFPIQRIICVGRNYVEHAQEMGDFKKMASPMFFFKPLTSLLVSNNEAEMVKAKYPLATSDYHFEGEAIVGLSSGGTNLTPEESIKCIYGIGCGLDMTRRDIQAEAKRLSHPWDMAKGADESAIISHINPNFSIESLSNRTLSLRLNGEIKQSCQLHQMIWNIPELISYLSTLIKLKAGDVIFTGTPAGVGAVEKGDLIDLSLEGLAHLSVEFI